MLQDKVVALAEAFLEQLDEPPIRLNGGDVACGVQQSFGQWAKPGADLDHRIVRREPGQTDDFAELILVVHEGLAKRPGQEDVLVVEQVTNLGEVHA